MINASLLTVALLLSGCSGSSDSLEPATISETDLRNMLPYTDTTVKTSVGEDIQIENVQTEFWPEAATFKMGESTVTKILEADLIELDGKYKVRLLGVKTEDSGEDGRIYYEFSKDKIVAFLEETILNKTVYVEQNPNTPTNNVGESLAYVWMGNSEKLTNVNALLIKNGLAISGRMEHVTVYDKSFKTLENEAKLNKVGMWKANN